MRLTISRIHFPVTTLGPGRRLGIWFQGCSIRCEGCVSADTWGFDRGTTTVADLIDQVSPWLRDAEGITISGGEPFDQAEALLQLLRGLPLSKDQDVLLFSGYPMDALVKSKVLGSGLVDALISEPFVAGSAQTLRLRGSDNQHLNLLTERGLRKFAEYDRPLRESERALDVMFDADGSVWLAGIPRQRDMLRLQSLLHGQGHVITTTDSPIRTECDS